MYMLSIHRISGIVACIAVLIIVLFASPVIDKVPAAALTGIMLAVVHHTFEWRSIPMVISAAVPRKVRKKFPKCMRQTKIRRGDAIVIVLVTIVVVVMNLVYAVLLGIVISCLIYTWYSGFDFHVHKEWVHRHHQKDRRFIKKFSDFHIHYEKRRGSRHGFHSRENSVETIDTMDPHYHGPPHYHGHDRFHRDHVEHSQISDHTHDVHPDHMHDNPGLDRLGSFGKDNKFTELHEIKDIHHLDSFLHKEPHTHCHSVHMQPLKEGVVNNNPDENAPKPLKHSMSAPINEMLQRDVEKIRDIHDTYNSKTNHENPAIRPMPTFDIDGIEHGTLRFNRLETFDCKLSDDGKLSDDTDDHHHTHFEKLSDCTNPEDINFGMKFNSDYILVYHFEGPLFFGNCRNLLKEFDPKNDPDQIEIHLRDACIYDFSAMNALNQVGEEYDKLGKAVHLRHINNKSHKLIAKAHHLVKYFSYDDVLKPMEPFNRNNITNKSQSSLSRINRYESGHEREISK